MAFYFIAIGGTGAKVAESVIHLAASGLFGKEPIRVLFVDPDESNGNLERARKSINIYQDCYGLVKTEDNVVPWLQTPLELCNPAVWSPLGNRINKTLSSLFGYSNYQIRSPEVGHLFDVLYTSEERDTSLDVGFRGRPAIGAAVMSQLKLERLDEEPWAELFSSIKTDISFKRDTRIFLCGSAFGGTGASGFPTIARLIANKLKESEQRDNIRLGGILLLPYFEFPVPKEMSNSREIYARPEQFLLNTEAALRYYRVQAQETFDTIYLLGLPDPASIERFSLGKADQRNEPHFVELYSALAARHFSTLQQFKKGGQVATISRHRSGEITWADFPDSVAVRERLVNTTRFAFAWLADIVPSLKDGLQMGFSKYRTQAPWATEFYRSGLFDRNLPVFEDATQQDAIKMISAWSENYFGWLASLHTSTGGAESLRLFNVEAFQDRSGQFKREPENFAKLVVEDTLSGERLRQDTIRAIKDRLRLRQGAIGGTTELARSLYAECQS